MSNTICLGGVWIPERPATSGQRQPMTPEETAWLDAACQDILENLIPPDPAFASIVDEHFWELI